eukprot:17667-Heterococcus_DN1.PRE.5
MVTCHKQEIGVMTYIISALTVQAGIVYSALAVAWHRIANSILLVTVLELRQIHCAGTGTAQCAQQCSCCDDATSSIPDAIA